MHSNRIFTSGKFRDRRRNLRRTMTSQEKLLWENLRNKRNGFKFRRQHSIGPYIVDFYSAEQKLVIEIDGSQHKETEANLYDTDRTKYLNSLGITVIRFWNSEVDTNLPKVLNDIKKIRPSPRGGEGVIL